MKKYFSYVKNVYPACTMPCVIDFEGQKYTSFANGYSIALTKKTSGEMKLFEEPDKYFNVQKMIVFDGEEKKIDFSKIIAEAKSKGYKLKKLKLNRMEILNMFFIKITHILKLVCWILHIVSSIMEKRLQYGIPETGRNVHL